MNRVITLTERLECEVWGTDPYRWWIYRDGNHLVEDGKARTRIGLTWQITRAWGRAERS